MSGVASCPRVRVRTPGPRRRWSASTDLYGKGERARSWSALPGRAPATTWVHVCCGKTQPPLPPLGKGKRSVKGPPLPLTAGGAGQAPVLRRCPDGRSGKQTANGMSQGASFARVPLGCPALMLPCGRV